MLKSLLIIIAIGSSSFYYTDISSSSALYSVILPFIDFIALIASGLWLVTLFHNKGINQTTRSRSTGSDSFSDVDGSGGGD